MLSRKNRIPRSDFKSFGRSVIFHSPTLFLSLYKKQNQSVSQFSFSCSKKVSKSAVQRNMLRRRGYASIAKMLERIQSGYYFVFSFKKGAEKLSSNDIYTEIDSLLEKSDTLA